jgi:5-formyltetrahydrofolate cyclo-ligase
MLSIMKKSDIRKLYKEKRNQLSKNEIDSIEYSIIDKIKTLNITSKKISLFLAIESQKEINTFKILKELEGSNQIYASKSDFSTFEMIHFQITSNSNLAINNYGIPEPTEGNQLIESEFDIVFTPLLAFDIQGNRVGYGKGFYDRFLSKCNSNCQFIGLSLFDEFTEIEDINNEDIKLNACITPSKIIYFE